VNHSRKAFIENSIKAAISIALLSPLRQLFGASKKNFGLPAWNDLVEYARWCPSVHNLQPHKVRIISETEAELYYDPARLLPVADPNAVFVTIAMGIFVEHLSIVAGSTGAKVIITEVAGPITTHTSAPTLFAKLKLIPAAEKEDLDKELIIKRRTSRLHYDGKKLRADTLDKVEAQAEQFDHKFFSTSDKEIVEFIIDLNQQTLFEDIGSKPDRDELNKLFRYTEEDAKTKKDGLWAKCMGFSGSMMKSVFTQHEKWQKGLRKKMLKKSYKSSFKGTTTIGWFAGSFDNTSDWLQAGRMLARNWLLITKEGAYIHPFGSLITNKGAYKQITERLTKSTENKKIWMIFRAGYSNEPTRSYRLSTAEILLT
jgi:hypothetical protein